MQVWMVLKFEHEIWVDNLQQFKLFMLIFNQVKDNCCNSYCNLEDEFFLLLLVCANLLGNSAKSMKGSGNFSLGEIIYDKIE